MARLKGKELDNLKKGSKDLLNNMSGHTSGKGDAPGGNTASDLIDEGKRQARILSQMRDNKGVMQTSIKQLDNEMLAGSMYGEFARASKRRSSLGINSKSQENAARRMREFQQNASNSQSNDLHARLCAENILRESELDPEVDISDKPNISVRQLLTIDDRCAGMHVRDARFEGRAEGQGGEGDGTMEFTSGLKKRNILSWRSLGRQA
jgi:hypothetical protein